MHSPSADSAPPDAPPAAAPQLPPERPAATRWARLGAAFLDIAFVMLLPGPSLALLQRPLASAWPKTFSTSIPGETALAILYGALPAIFFAIQWILFARSGRTAGAHIVGVAWERPSGGPPGPARALLHRIFPVLLFAGALTTLLPGAHAIWIRAGLALAIIATVLFDAIALLLPGRRSLRDRLIGLRAVSAGADDGRAFVPPHFSGIGFALAVLGLIGSFALAGLVYWLVGLLKFESTDIDIPSVAAGAAVPLGLVAAGAISAFFARRFLVGELALTSLLAALLAFEGMAAGWFRVPAMQRFEVAGWLDWSVYGGAGYFLCVVFLIIGSALGFMVASDDGLDVSTSFERLVARRHLRLQLKDYGLLAAVAALAPIVIYGLIIWPIRETRRLVKGERNKKPLPATVFMSLLTILAVILGVTALNVVLAVMGGFERDLKEKILGTNAHGVVHRYVGDFTEWRDVERKIKAVPGVEGVTPFILSEVMITTESSVAGSVLKGIDVETAGQVTDLEKNIDVDNGSLKNLLYPDRIPRKAKPPPDTIEMDEEAPPQKDGLTDEKPAEEAKGDEDILPGIVVGREMARSLHVWIGDRVTVMNPLGELGPSGPIPRSRTFRIAAVFVSGMYEYDSKFAYITLREAQRFFRMGDAVTGLELRFHNVDDARPLMRKILNVLEGFPYRAKDWGEMNKNLFSALRLERVVMSIILGFLVLIACICVVATLVMLVVEKRREVATLKAMGAREGSIMKLFVIEGLIIGAIGTGGGSAAGYLFCKLIEKFGVGLDPAVYYITRLPVVIEPAAFISVAFTALVLVFVATIYPARRGGSIAPVEGFREE